MMMAPFSAEPYGRGSPGAYSRRSANGYRFAATVAPASASRNAIARPISRNPPSALV